MERLEGRCAWYQGSNRGGHSVDAVGLRKKKKESRKKKKNQPNKTLNKKIKSWEGEGRDSLRPS